MKLTPGEASALISIRFDQVLSEECLRACETTLVANGLVSKYDNRVRGAYILTTKGLAISDLYL